MITEYWGGFAKDEEWNCITMSTQRLWTWQDMNWDIRCQPYSPALCEKYWNRETGTRIVSLYKRLQKNLGTDQCIWCFTHYEYWKGLPCRRLWVIDVPKAAILRWVDSYIWNKIIFSGNYIQMSEKTAWQKLFTTQNHIRKTIALLALPVDPEWVVDNSSVSRQDDCANCKYENLHREYFE